MAAAAAAAAASVCWRAEEAQYDIFLHFWMGDGDSIDRGYGPSLRAFFCTSESECTIRSSIHTHSNKALTLTHAKLTTRARKLMSHDVGGVRSTAKGGKRETTDDDTHETEPGTVPRAVVLGPGYVGSWDCGTSTATTIARPHGRWR